jgi:hypothetical protein
MTKISLEPGREAMLPFGGLRAKRPLYLVFVPGSEKAMDGFDTESLHRNSISTTLVDA